MVRYIDADNAISVFEILADKCDDDKAFEQAISVLKDVPTEDVRENVHARWKIYNILDYANRPTGRRVGQCSNCGQLTPEWRKLLEEPLWYFCPRCGAQMDGGGDDGGICKC